MSYKIMIHPMPENWDKCPCLERYHCRVHIDEVCTWRIYGKCDVLMPAEPWQFETCETCGLKNRVLTSNPPQVCKNIMTVKGTCKEWRAK